MKYLGWGNDFPEVVKKYHHKLKEETRGRCEYKYTYEICCFYYMVDGLN